MSRILPLYYLLASFVFLACLLHQSYLVSTRAISQLTLTYQILTLICVGYLIVVLIVSMRIIFLNIQENRDMISTSLIFIMV